MPLEVNWSAAIEEHSPCMAILIAKWHVVELAESCLVVVIIVTGVMIMIGLGTCYVISFCIEFYLVGLFVIGSRLIGNVSEKCGEFTYAGRCVIVQIVVKILPLAL